MIAWRLGVGFWTCLLVACGDDGGTSDSMTGSGTTGAPAATTGETTGAPTTGESSDDTATPTTGTSVGACIDEAGATVFEHEGGVIQDETWQPGLHILKASLTVNGLLIVEPCSTIKMPDGGVISVRDGGAIRMLGTAELPIKVTSGKPVKARGDHSGIEIYDTSVGPNNALQHVTVEYGGAGGYGMLWLQAGASAAITDSAFQQSSDHGLVVETDAELREFTGNAVIDNAKGALRIAPRGAGQLGPGTYAPNDVDQILLDGAGVNSDSTWLAHDAPYVSVSGFEVTTPSGSARLTVSAGATIRLGNGAIVSVRDNAGLTMVGTADQPITLTSNKAVGSPGDWAEIDIYDASADLLNEFDHVVLEYGGSSVYGQLWVDSGASVAVRNSIIRDGADTGVYVAAGGELREFADNTVTGNAKGAVRLWANAVDQLQAGTYGPNGVDGIIVEDDTVDHDCQWQDHGVPYIFITGMRVRNDSGSALLEILAGAELRVGDGGILGVQDNGGLRLSGTADMPVRITSAKPAPAPGDWAEIDLYASSVGPENVFTYAEIAYGGGNVYGQVWVESSAAVTLDHVTFTGAGMGCDVYEGGAVNAIMTSYMACM